MQHARIAAENRSHCESFEKLTNKATKTRVKNIISNELRKRCAAAFGIAFIVLSKNYNKARPRQHRSQQLELQ